MGTFKESSSSMSNHGDKFYISLLTKSVKYVILKLTKLVNAKESGDLYLRKV